MAIDSHMPFDLKRYLFSISLSLGHPCIADQSPDYRARLKEAAGGDSTAINEFQPVPPAQFLKYFSL